jgi:uncharacterized protein YybS (DUF2232 family)
MYLIRLDEVWIYLLIFIISININIINIINYDVKRLFIYDYMTI